MMLRVKTKMTRAMTSHHRVARMENERQLAMKVFQDPLLMRQKHQKV